VFPNPNKHKLKKKQFIDVVVQYLRLFKVSVRFTYEVANAYAIPTLTN